MITFENNIFHLSNSSISYIIYLNSDKHLETIYFGKQIEEVNIVGARFGYKDNNSTTFYSKSKEEEFFYPDLYNSKVAREEISSHGLNDNRPSPIIIKKENGDYTTNFIYISHRIYKGLPQYKNIPHVHGDNAETLEIILKDELSDVEMKFNISIITDNDIIVKNYELINKGDKNVHLLKAMSMQLDLLSTDYVLHHFVGSWYNERNEVINKLVDGIQEISSNNGRSSHEENPFVYLSSNNDNEVIGFNLVYSGNFKFQIYLDCFLSPHILYGINDYDFDFLLTQNESFITPQAVISYSYNDTDKMSQNFHSFVQKNIIRYKNKNEIRPVMFNSWEGAGMDFTTESMKEYATKAAKEINAELFVLDDGWFSTRNDDYHGLGDWWINENKINLKELSEYVHSLGMKFGLWFEPEMINPDTELYKNHPQYVLGRNIARDNITIHRHQFMLDFTNPEVVEVIFNQIIKVLDNVKIDYIKWDMNRDIKEKLSSYLPSSRQGEVLHRYVLGYYSLLEKITNRYPNMMIEGCASGGGRFDLGTLYYCPLIWTSDNSNPAERLYIQYATSIGYPLSTISSHVNNYWITSYKTKAELAFFGGYGFEMNPTKLNDKEIGEINSITEIYKKYHKSVIIDGDLYHLSSPFESNYMVMESVSKNKNTVIILFMNKRFEKQKYRFIKLKGLDPNTKYKSSFDNNVYLGEQLMQIGLNLSNEWLDEFNSKFIILEKL